MARFVVIAWLVLVAIQSNATPGTSVLHVSVSIVDAAGQPVPLARHALLVSDNPATSLPQRLVTRPDGTAEIRLRPGKYTVESDRPAVLQGRA